MKPSRSRAASRPPGVLIAQASIPSSRTRRPPLISIVSPSTTSVTVAVVPPATGVLDVAGAVADDEGAAVAVVVVRGVDVADELEDADEGLGGGDVGEVHGGHE